MLHHPPYVLVPFEFGVIWNSADWFKPLDEHKQLNDENFDRSSGKIVIACLFL